MPECPEQPWKEMLQTLHQMQVTLEGARSKLEDLLRMMHDHEQRLRSVERFQNMLTPTLAAITFVLGAVSKNVMDRLF